MILSNPCLFSDLMTYSESVPFTDDNKFINLIYLELNKIGNIRKRTIASIFKLLMHTLENDEKYIDIGCTVLTILSHGKKYYYNMVLNLKNGDIGVIDGSPENNIPDSKKISEVSNSIKMILINNSHLSGI